jgi:hypothetical protein
VIHHDGRATIVETLLTLILKMGPEGFDFHFCLYRQPIISIWWCATCCPPDYPWYTTNNCQRSIDAHFPDGEGRVLQSILPTKAAKKSCMTDYNISEMWFVIMYEQKLLTLLWHLVERWGREVIAICFTYQGSQTLLYDWLQPISSVISQDAWSKIVDVLWTLIYKMRLKVCRYYFANKDGQY